MRDHIHSRRGPAETAAAASSAYGRRCPEEQPPGGGELGEDENHEERPGRGPLLPVLGHDGGVDDGAADQPDDQQRASSSLRPALREPTEPGVLTLSRPPMKATAQATSTRLVASRIRLPQPTERAWSQKAASSSATRHRPGQFCRIVPIIRSACTWRR